MNDFSGIDNQVLIINIFYMRMDEILSLKYLLEFVNQVKNNSSTNYANLNLRSC